MLTTEQRCRTFGRRNGTAGSGKSNPRSLAEGSRTRLFTPRHLITYSTNIWFHLIITTPRNLLLRRARKPSCVQPLPLWRYKQAKPHDYAYICTVVCARRAKTITGASSSSTPASRRSLTIQTSHSNLHNLASFSLASIVALHFSTGNSSRLLPVQSLAC